MSDGEGHPGATLKDVLLSHPIPTMGQVEHRLLGDHILCSLCNAVEVAGVHVFLEDKQTARLKQKGKEMAGGQVLATFLQGKLYSKFGNKYYN